MLIQDCLVSGWCLQTVHGVLTQDCLVSGWYFQTVNDVLKQDCLASGWYLQTVHDNKTPLNKLEEEKEEEEVSLFVVDVRSTTKLKSRRIQFIKTLVKA